MKYFNCKDKSRPKLTKKKKEGIQVKSANFPTSQLTELDQKTLGNTELNHFIPCKIKVMKMEILNLGGQNPRKKGKIAALNLKTHNFQTITCCVDISIIRFGILKYFFIFPVTVQLHFDTLN